MTSLPLSGLVVGRVLFGANHDGERQAMIPWQSTSGTSAGPLWLWVRLFSCGETSVGSSTALTELTDSLGETPTPAQGLTVGFGFCLSWKESYEILPQSVTCRKTHCSLAPLETHV